MKKILNLLLLFIITLFTCGCTHADICNEPKAWSVFDVSKEHKEYIYSYNMACVISPSFAKREYTEDTYQRLTMLADKFNDGYFNEIFNNPEAMYSDVLLKLVVNTFGMVVEDVNVSYQEYEENPADIRETLMYYYKIAQEKIDRQKLYARINAVINYLDSKGYLNNPKVVNLICFRLETFVDVDSNKNLSIFEPLLFKVSMKNGLDNSNLYNSFSFGGYYYKDKNYYTKYRN